MWDNDMDERRRPNAPVIGLIGPTNLQRISAASGIAEAHYKATAFEVGQAIARAGAVLAVVPDRGVALLGMQGYRGAEGPWTLALVPSGGPSESVATSNCLENSEACDEVVTGFTWHHQHARMCELSDLMICVGLSCGTLAEIAWTKWIQGPRILVMRDTVTALPNEILAETQITFIDTLDELAASVHTLLGSDRAAAGGRG